MPRLWLEQISVLCLGLFIIFALNFKIDLNLILPVLALTCAAAFRVLPSLNRIINSYQGFKFYSPIIDLLYKEFKSVNNINNSLQKIKNQKDQDFKFDNQVEFKDVNFGYISTNNNLENISFIIKKGDKIGITGGSGSGKSTLLDLFMGLIEPNSGQIIVDNMDIKNNLKTWHNLIGYVPQSVFF